MDHEFERMLPKDAASIAAGIRFHHKGSQDLLKEATSASDFIHRLMAANFDSDAIRFLAQAMPIRESIWWGLLCVWRVFGPTPEEKEVWAIQSAIQWVTDPNETRRRAASSAAHAVGNNTAPGCLANAVFWSGGSISKVGMPTAHPPETSAGKAVGGAILLAAAKIKKAPKCREFRREFLLLGLDVARGKNLWSTPTAAHEPTSQACEEKVDVTAKEEAVTSR